MTCREITEILIEFVDGTLDSDQHAMLELHLCGCIPCAIYLHTYRETIRVTQALPEAPLPPEFAERLKALLSVG